MRLRAGILVLALTAVSCSGGGSTGTTTGPSATQAPSPTPTEPAAAGTYATVREMQLDVEAAFYLCSAPIKVYDPPTVDGAIAQADCSRDVALLIFEPNDVQTGVAALQGSAEAPLTLLVGNNWIISCSSDQATCEKIQGITGGELITSS